MGNKQYVYILSNTQNPSILKIGKTDKHPEIRTEQLSNQTGTIGKYICEWYKEVSDNNFYEAFLHLIFKPFHLDKEHFEMNKSEAIKVAESAIDSIQELMYNYIFDEYAIKETIPGMEIVVKYAEEDREAVTNRLNRLKLNLETIKRLKK